MKDVVCLFEESGLSAAPWAEAGHDVYCYDILHKTRRYESRGKGRIIYMPWDAIDHQQNVDITIRHIGCAQIVLCFPPCTDLAVTGAAHFASKRLKDKNFQLKAMDLVFTARDLADSLNCPWALENPISVISTLWRKPDYIFDPWEYGGYLPEDDIHPLYPEYIEPRDAYPKRTCYWTGGGFIMPEKKPVLVKPGYSKQHRKLGGKSAKTKQIRSASPRGIAQAIFEANG